MLAQARRQHPPPSHLTAVRNCNNLCNVRTVERVQLLCGVETAIRDVSAMHVVQFPSLFLYIFLHSLETCSVGLTFPLVAFYSMAVWNICNCKFPPFPSPNFTLPPGARTTIPLRQACTSSLTKPRVAVRSLGLVASPPLYHVRSSLPHIFRFCLFSTTWTLFVASYRAKRSDRKQKKIKNYA